MRINIKNFTIEITYAHNKYYYVIHLGEHVILRGIAETEEEAKEKAFEDLENELELTKIEAKLARFEQYEKKPFRAFQWYPGVEHEDIGTLNGEQYFYKGMLLNSGDWVLPSEGVVLTNKLFQKLFSKVTT